MYQQLIKEKYEEIVSKFYKFEIKILKYYSNNEKFVKFKDFLIIIERNF